MARSQTNSRAQVEQLRTRLLETEDGLSRLVSLCHLGGLAADGMHGLGRNPDATALAFYFMMLRAELERLREACRAAR